MQLGCILSQRPAEERAGLEIAEERKGKTEMYEERRVRGEERGKGRKKRRDGGGNKLEVKRQQRYTRWYP
ncbi:hypothetical protein M8J75_013775 [Diaphorina citri]|nr:hypothetical protein M8J75_013775 [Diaphorina citri]